ncbi:MAG: NADH-quinone oxidoreductase subunit J [Candidatus Alcyoniella australis]|nr:NADH-quinone oxidoreductase subunit J [Candidatus Alcyoniella australis]
MEFGAASSVVFAVLALLTLGSGLSVVLQRNPINSAISLLFAFIGLSGLYILINAQLIALFQVMVYAGAILVLIVFVIMLLNLKEEGKPGFFVLRGPARLAGLLAAVLLLVEVLYVLTDLDPRTGDVPASTFGDPTALAELLFTRYVFAFEIASVLLLVAIVGAVILTRKPQDEGDAHEKQEGDDVG